MIVMNSKYNIIRRTIGKIDDSHEDVIISWDGCDMRAFPKEDNRIVNIPKEKIEKCIICGASEYDSFLLSCSYNGGYVCCGSGKECLMQLVDGLKNKVKDSE